MGYINILTQAALAPSTLSTYQRAWKQLEQFSTEICVPITLPLSVATISLFIAYMFKKAFAPTTISTYLSAISYVHKMLSLPDGTRSFLVDKLISGTYRLAKCTLDSRLPITVPVLNKLLIHLPMLTSRYDCLLYKALFLTAFSAWARIGELVMTKNVPLDSLIQLQDITVCYSQGIAQEIEIRFRKFKHNVKGQAKVIKFSKGPANESAVEAVVQYLKVRPSSNIQTPLFCSCLGKPTTRSDFDRVLHQCLKACGLDSSKYKGHSFRIGAATFASEQGLSDSQIRSLGRWKSNAFYKYIRSNGCA